jgi:hypothetical protein
VKDVVEGPMIGMEVTVDKFGSARDRRCGEDSLIESIEVAGDMPSEAKERRFRGWD